MRLQLASIAIVTAAVITEGLAHAADPTTADCLAASDASLKLGNQHRLRTERSQLLVCAATNCPADIRKECVRRVDEVNAQIPTIVFQVKDPSGADLTAVKVTMDGEVLAERLEGTALSIDPGEHTFTFDTAGQSSMTERFLIQQAQKDRREVVTLGTPAVTPPPQPSTPDTQQQQPAPLASGASGRSGMATQKILALAAGGIGAVGLGIGTAFGVMALSKKSDAQNVCPGSSCATADGASKWSDAASSGNISTVALIVGAVAVAGGAVLWFTAPSSVSSGTKVGVSVGGFQVKGTW